jgi:muramoyltetrapeptide carboxypeptidase LdcA involved in peptidoglycan recycling
MPKLAEGEKEMVLKFFKFEVERIDLPILTNVDFGHRTPMTVLPIGAMAEIDCDAASFSILESGVE